MSHKFSPNSADRRRTLFGAGATLFGWLSGPRSRRGDDAVADEAPKPHSTTFEKFRFSFFEDPDAARDQLVTAPLLELRGEERALAEQMLLDFLPDGRAIIGLGLLRSQRAKPRLLEIFGAERIKAVGLYATRESEVTLLDLIWSAQALWRIQPSPSYAEALIENLGASANDMDRSEAAAALEEMPIPEVDSALLGFLDDRDSLVRYHVARSLLLIHGQTPNDFDAHSVMARIGSNDPARRGSGKRDLLAVVSNTPLVSRRD
jgi:HEAT repeat protein